MQDKTRDDGVPKDNQKHKKIHNERKAMILDNGQLEPLWCPVQELASDLEDCGE
jgi:hypothetical protein